MRPAIVDLRDLNRRYAWHSREIQRFIETAGVELGEGASRSFVPPRVLVVITPYGEPQMLRRSQPWLVEAAHVVVVRDGYADEGLAADAELFELFEGEWRQALAELPSHEVFEWGVDACRDAVRAAIAAHARLGPVEPAPVTRGPSQIELPPSSWVEFGGDRITRWRLLETVVSQLTTDGAKASTTGTPIPASPRSASIRSTRSGGAAIG